MCKRFLRTNINTEVVIALDTLVCGQGGVPMDPNSENAFSRGVLSTKDPTGMCR